MRYISQFEFSNEKNLYNSIDPIWIYCCCCLWNWFFFSLVGQPKKSNRMWWTFIFDIDKLMKIWYRNVFSWFSGFIFFFFFYCCVVFDDDNNNNLLFNSDDFNWFHFQQNHITPLVDCVVYIFCLKLWWKNLIKRHDSNINALSKN